MNMSPGTGGSASIGMSNVGFLLSFIDDASPHLKRVTSAYRQLTSAMDEAYKKANQTGLFTNGLERIIRGMEKYVEIGHQAVGLMASFSQLSRGKFGKVSVDVKLRRLPRLVPLAEGGIVTRPTRALIGENGPEAVIPLKKGRGGSGWVGPMVAGGAMGEISGMVGKIKSDYGEIEQHVMTINELSKRMRQYDAGSRKDMLKTRNLLSQAFKGAAYDIEDATEAIYNLSAKAELSTEDAIKLGKTIALLKHYQGIDLGKFAENLSFYSGMATDDVNQLMLELSKGWSEMEKRTGVKIGLNVLDEYLQKEADLARLMRGTWKAADMPKYIKSMTLLGGELYQSGIDADIINDVIKEVNLGTPEAINKLTALGLTQRDVNAALLAGKPEDIMKPIFAKASQAYTALQQGSLQGAQMRSAFEDVFGSAGDSLIDMGARADDFNVAASKMHGQTEGIGASFDSINKKAMGVYSTFQKIGHQVDIFSKTNVVFQNLVNTFEGLLPMLESLFFFVGLFKMSGFSKMFTGLLKGAKGLEEGEKIGLIPKMLFGKKAEKGMFKLLGKSKIGKIAGKSFAKGFGEGFGLFSKGFGKGGGEILNLLKVFSKFKMFGGIIGSLVMLLPDLFLSFKFSLPFRIALEDLRLQFMQIIDTVKGFAKSILGSGSKGLVSVFGFLEKVGKKIVPIWDRVARKFDWLGKIWKGIVSWDIWKTIGGWIENMDVSTGILQVLELVLDGIKFVVWGVMTTVESIVVAAQYAKGLIDLIRGKETWKNFTDIYKGGIDTSKGIWKGLFEGRKEVDVQKVRADMGMGAVVKDKSGKDVLVNVDMSGLEKRMDAARALQKQQLEEQKKTRKAATSSVGGIPLADLGVSVW